MCGAHGPHRHAAAAAAHGSHGAHLPAPARPPVPPRARAGRRGAALPLARLALGRDSPKPNKTLRTATLDTRDRDVRGVPRHAVERTVVACGLRGSRAARSGGRGEPWSVRKLTRKQEALRRFARGCPVDVERSRPARIRAGSLRSRSTGNLDYPWHACFRRPGLRLGHVRVRAQAA